MEIIPIEFIEDSWQELDEIDPLLAQEQMQIVYDEQPNICEFLSELTEEFDDELGKLSLYIFLVIYRAIKSYYGMKIKKIPDSKLIKIHEKNIDLMESLEGSHEVFVEKFAKRVSSKQPYIYHYISSTLFDEVYEELEMTDDERGYLFLIMQTVVEALNSNN